MPESIKEKLLKVPIEKLVDLLVELSGESDVSWSKVERLVSDHKENIARFKRRLKEIKSRDGFVPWKYSDEFAGELSDLLSDLKASLSPEIGFELICDFFKADSTIFEMCDDSSGQVGTVFHSDAFDVFKTYALQHPNRELVLNAVVELVAGNDYGARDVLVSEAHQYLSEPELRKLFQRFEEKNRDDTDKFPRWEWKMASCGA